MNFMLKVKIGGELHNLFYLLDRNFDYWWGVLRSLFLVASCHVFGRIVFFGKLIMDVKLPIFLFRPEVISMWVVAGLIPLAHLV
jgi:hypothetical protein